MSKTKIVLGIVVLGIIALVLWQTGVIASVTNGDVYKAVFLTNGQVYFGKIRSEQGQFVTVTDIFYLQVQQAVQPIAGNEPAGQNVALIKLGGELHAPEDEMRLNRDHILFIEDLKIDSQVVQRINDFKTSQESE